MDTQRGLSFLMKNAMWIANEKEKRFCRVQVELELESVEDSACMTSRLREVEW